MIKITARPTQFKTLRPGDPYFVMDNGLVMTPRAGFEISQDCPRNYLTILQTCIDRGWIKPIAYMKESEYTWELLQT